MFEETLRWFGKTIAQPLSSDHTLPEHSRNEADRYIAASPTLEPHERIELYYQQYWWRLLKCLNTNFPTLIRLFGERPFEQTIAVPYLSAHPPQHWALCRLGETLPDYLDAHYAEPDAYLITEAAAIDWASQKAFWSGGLPSLSPLSTESSLLRLQPYVSIFSLQGDLFSFRDHLLKKSPAHYSTHPFPELIKRPCYFIIYRTPHNVVAWEEISLAEYILLSLFKEGNTVDKACLALEELGGEIFKKAQENLPKWFKKWTVLEWFGQYSSSLQSLYC